MLDIGIEMQVLGKFGQTENILLGILSMHNVDIDRLFHSLASTYRRLENLLEQSGLGGVPAQCQ